MSNEKIDPSLAEVRQWRAKVQEEFAQLDPKAEIEETHRRAQNFLRAHGLTAKTGKKSPEVTMA